VLVLGANGQLGLCIKRIAPQQPQLLFTFLSVDELDITDEVSVKETFSKGNYDFCINCAAYTNVDASEDQADLAFKVNAIGPRYLARTCSQTKTKLIHVSTDFVFDGQKKTPYTEQDNTNPLGVYGESKLKGEEEIMKYSDQYFIIRTSWLYSEFGKNFVKTMIDLTKTRTAISVVNDQIGSPTYALDLAGAILRIIDYESTDYGVYHYSNKGKISWFDFASKVFELKGIDIDLTPIKTKDYPTKARRPSYSVLDTEKIERALEMMIGNWDDRLPEALKEIHV
ncbi:MAG: dTDP-4-dehydrorhamnose reductase, partial [Bacteroidota bacterium]